MKAADAKQQRMFGGIIVGASKVWRGRIDTHTPDDDFGRIQCRIVFEYVIAIEFRDSQAEAAVFQLGVEVGSVHQEIGAVQGHAEADAEHARRNHGDPGREVSVMHVDVLDAAPFEQQGVIDAEPGVKGCARPAQR